MSSYFPFILFSKIRMYPEQQKYAHGGMSWWFEKVSYVLETIVLHHGAFKEHDFFLIEFNFTYFQEFRD